jgi:hypothetical protein
MFYFVKQNCYFYVLFAYSVSNSLNLDFDSLTSSIYRLEMAQWLRWHYRKNDSYPNISFKFNNTILLP